MHCCSKFLSEMCKAILTISKIVVSFAAEHTVKALLYSCKIIFKHKIGNSVFVYIVFPHGLSHADMISQLRHQKTLSDFWRSHEKINARIEQTIYNRKLIFINGIIQFAQSHDVDIVGMSLNTEPCKCQ